MALAYTVKFNGTLNADTNPTSKDGTVDCGTVTNGALLTIAVGATKQGTSTTPFTTPSKASGTATIGTVTSIGIGVTSTSDTSALQVWQVAVTGGGTLVLNIQDAVNTFGFGVEVIEWTGQDTSTPIAGAVTAAAASAGNFSPTTATLGATPVSGDYAVAWANWDTDTGTKAVTAGSGFTAFSTVLGGSGNYVEQRGQYRTGSTSTTVTWPTQSGPTTYSRAGVAFIVKAAAGGTVSKSDSDTGSGTEGTPTLTVTTSSTDTGSGTEGTPTLTVTTSSTDTGSGTEGTPRVNITGSDTGSAAEGTPQVAQTLADTGSGTEAGTVSASLTSAETGAGAEGTPQVAVGSTETGAASEGTPVVAVGSADTGSGAEGMPQTAISSTDTATGAEGIPQIALSSTDTGSGVDDGTVDTSGGSVAKSDSDTGTGTEGTPTLTATLSASDTGAGSEGQAVAATLSDGDTGSGTETGSVWDGTVAPSEDDRPSRRRRVSKGALRQKPQRTLRVGFPEEPTAVEIPPLAQVAVTAVARLADDEELLLLL